MQKDESKINWFTGIQHLIIEDASEKQLYQQKIFRNASVFIILCSDSIVKDNMYFKVFLQTF